MTYCSVSFISVAVSLKLAACHVFVYVAEMPIQEWYVLRPKTRISMPRERFFVVSQASSFSRHHYPAAFARIIASIGNASSKVARLGTGNPYAGSREASSKTNPESSSWPRSSSGRQHNHGHIPERSLPDIESACSQYDSAPNLLSAPH